MSVFDEAHEKVNMGGETRNGPPSEHGVLTLSLSLLAIAEAINGLTEVISQAAAPRIITGGDFDPPKS